MENEESVSFREDVKKAIRRTPRKEAIMTECIGFAVIYLLGRRQGRKRALKEIRSLIWR